VRLEGLGQLKHPMTSSRIETAIFRLAAQCLNQLRSRVTLTQKWGEGNRRTSNFVMCSFLGMFVLWLLKVFKIRLLKENISTRET
jgi:hypothetical protein